MAGGGVPGGVAGAADLADGLAQHAVEAGFGFHHSGDDYLLMTLRLEEGAFIPPYASHYIGAGGVVIKDGSLLVVHERRGPVGGPRYYKLPGGALHEGEHLVEGVVREVLEETGVRTRFQSLVCFRNLHGYRYGKSDIYFVCKLEALSHEIVPQAEEIEECQVDAPRGLFRRGECEPVQQESSCARRSRARG